MSGGRQKTVKGGTYIITVYCRAALHTLPKQSGWAKITIFPGWLEMVCFHAITLHHTASPPPHAPTLLTQSSTDIGFTNVPNIRIAFRTETRQEEVDILRAGGPILSPADTTPSPSPTLELSPTSSPSTINVSTDAMGTLPSIPKLINYNRVIIVNPTIGMSRSFISFHY